MGKTIITIYDDKAGKCFFVKENGKIFAIISEIVRIFNYNPVSGHSNPSSCSSILRKSVVKFDLQGTKYSDFLKQYGEKGKLNHVSSKPCIEVEMLMNYLNKSKQSASSGKKDLRKFMFDNFPIYNVNNDSPKELFESTSQNTVSDPFDNLGKEISSLKNKFKAMQINLDSQKEQIDVKDKSIFALRAKIKELEKQNAELKTKLEKQSTLNDSFGAFVRSWNSINNATA